MNGLPADYFAPDAGPGRADFAQMLHRYQKGEQKNDWMKLLSQIMPQIFGLLGPLMGGGRGMDGRGMDVPNWIWKSRDHHKDIMSLMQPLGGL